MIEPDECHRRPADQREPRQVIRLGPSRQPGNEFGRLFEELPGLASVLWPLVNVPCPTLQLLEAILPLRGQLRRRNLFKYLVQDSGLLLNGAFE